MAIKDGVFRSGEARLTVAKSIFAAKQLRNSASHGAAWQRSPGEVQATNVLGMLVCYSGTLFPSPPLPTLEHPYEDLQWWGANVTKADPSCAAQVLSRAVRTQSITYASAWTLARHIVRSAGPSAVLNTYDLLARTPIGRDMFREVASAEFVSLLANLGRARTGSVEKVCQKLHVVGLKAEARIIAACLPRTPEALAYYLHGSPYRFAQYLSLLRSADRQTFETGLIAEGSSQPLATGIARLIRDRRGVVSNVAFIMERLPRPVVVRALRMGARDLEAWVDGSAHYALVVLKAMRARHLASAGEAVRLANAMSSSLLERLNMNTLLELEYPRLAREAVKWKLSDDPALVPIWEKLIVVTESEADTSIALQVLWPLKQWLPIQQDRLARAIRAILLRDVSGDSASRLALTGALALDGYDMDVAECDVRAAAAHPPEAFDILLLAALPCCGSEREVGDAGRALLEAARARITSADPNERRTTSVRALIAAVGAHVSEVAL
jgi:hypothetical protein